MIIRGYFLCALICLLAPAAFAQNSGRDMEKERLIWQELEAVAPRSVDTFKAATVALDAGDYKEAVRLYEEVFKKAPRLDHVLRRLGISLIEAGRYDEGLPLLEGAVSNKRSPENLISLANYLAYPGEGKSSSNSSKERAFMLAREARRESKDSSPDYIFITARIAFDLEKEYELREATKALVDKYPNTIAAHYFSGVVAMLDNDWIKAEDEIKKAESLGLPSEVANDILASGIHTRATVWRYAYYSLYMVVAWALGLGLLFVLGKAMSKKTLRWIETADPNAPTGANQISLRKHYRWLVNVAGLYYYVSIPVVNFLAIAISASLIYGFFMIGWIPINLLGLIALGAIVTAYKMIRSLFVRREEEDPGRSLAEAEAPGLWAVAREVAQTVGTRPVDEIRVTPGTEVAVYERGSFTERMQDKARRILILGIGTINGFNQNAFRAVLAHEYGHFSHRDTAGGDVAIRVNKDMTEFAIAIIESEQNVPWNVAFPFLRFYMFLFRRISHGAMRLQEVLADRVAVMRYGARAFEEGLSHVIRRDVEFEDVTYWEITNAAKARRAVQNLYELNPEGRQRIEEKINEEINRQTEDDTHPCAADRFRYASRIECKNETPAAGQVWDLFENREALTNEMSALINKEAKAFSAG